MVTEVVAAAAGRFRKKFTFALLIFAAGTFIAVTQSSSLGEYTVFGTFLLGIFGTADLIDKDKFSKEMQ